MIGTKSDEVVDVMKELFSSKENPYDATVIDFVKNFRAHYNPSHKVFCDVLIFAVNNSKYAYTDQYCDLVHTYLNLCRKYNTSSTLIIYIPV